MNFSEILLLMAIALILFGPEDLPDIARTVGRIVYEIRKATADLTSGFQDIAKNPVDIINKAYEETTRTSVGKASQENIMESRVDEEELLTYEGKSDQSDTTADKNEKKEYDPLAELPDGMVTYEEKGTSR